MHEKGYILDGPKTVTYNGVINASAQALGVRYHRAAAASFSTYHRMMFKWSTVTFYCHFSPFSNKTAARIGGHNPRKLSLRVWPQSRPTCRLAYGFMAGSLRKSIYLTTCRFLYRNVTDARNMICDYLMHV